MIQAVAVLLLVVVTIFNLGAGLLWARSKRAKAERAVPIGSGANDDDGSDQTMREVEGGGFSPSTRRPLDSDLETATLYDVNATDQTTPAKPIGYAERSDQPQQPSTFATESYPTYESAPHPLRAPALQL